MLIKLENGYSYMSKLFNINLNDNVCYVNFDNEKNDYKLNLNEINYTKDDDIKDDDIKDEDEDDDDDDDNVIVEVDETINDDKLLYYYFDKNKFCLIVIYNSIITFYNYQLNKILSTNIIVNYEDYIMSYIDDKFNIPFCYIKYMDLKTIKLIDTFKVNSISFLLNSSSILNTYSDDKLISSLIVDDSEIFISYNTFHSLFIIIVKSHDIFKIYNISFNLISEVNSINSIQLFNNIIIIDNIEMSIFNFINYNVKNEYVKNQETIVYNQTDYKTINYFGLYNYEFSILFNDTVFKNRKFNITSITIDEPDVIPNWLENAHIIINEEYIFLYTIINNVEDFYLLKLNKKEETMKTYIQDYETKNLLFISKFISKEYFISSFNRLLNCFKLSIENNNIITKDSKKVNIKFNDESMLFCFNNILNNDNFIINKKESIKLNIVSFLNIDLVFNDIFINISKYEKKNVLFQGNKNVILPESINFRVNTNNEPIITNIKLYKSNNQNNNYYNKLRVFGYLLN